jgi:hypothetical protein
MDSLKVLDPEGPIREADIAASGRYAGAIIVREMAPEHSEVDTHTTPKNDGQVTLDIGVADLRGSLQ